MIALLNGLALPGSVVLTDSGVGYLVHTATPLTEGERVTLHIHTAVREDAITLYGFTSILEQELFCALTAVPGCGPAMAMALLRDLGPGMTVTALLGSDIKALAKAKGVGPKQAEKIITLVKLSPGLVELAISEAIDVAAVEAPALDAGPVEELAEALEGFGYSPEQSRRAATAAVAQAEQDAERLRIALALLAGKAA